MASEALPGVSEARLLSPTGCEATRWQLDVPLPGTGLTLCKLKHIRMFPHEMLFVFFCLSISFPLNKFRMFFLGRKGHKLRGLVCSDFR